MAGGLLAAILAPDPALSQVALMCEAEGRLCPSAVDSYEAGRVCTCTTGETVFVGTTRFVERSDAASDDGAGAAGPTAEPGRSIKASRGFAGPGQMPPENYAAWGMVIFKSRAAPFDVERHEMICTAYLNALPHGQELSTPTMDQMVTIWPIESDAEAERIDALPREDACSEAVGHYGLVAALDALDELEAYEALYGAQDTSGPGPFLVAWSPARQMFEPGSVALFLDLSHVQSYDEATHFLGLWRDRIQDDPAIWRDGFRPDGLADLLRRFFDRYGAVVEIVRSP